EPASFWARHDQPRSTTPHLRPPDPRSDHADVLSLFALPAWGHVELDTLTLLEGAVARALDIRKMNEQIPALLTRDKPIALLGVEKLHCSCCQLRVLPHFCELTLDRAHSVGRRARAREGPVARASRRRL